MRAGVLGQDEHAVALVHERRLLRDEVESVEDRVHEQHVVLLVGGDRRGEVVRDAQRERLPARRCRTGRSPRAPHAGSRARYSAYSGMSWRDGSSSASMLTRPCSSGCALRGAARRPRKPRTTFLDGSVRSTRSDAAAPGRSRRARRSASSTASLAASASNSPGRRRSDARDDARRPPVVRERRTSRRRTRAEDVLAAAQEVAPPALACGSRRRRSRAARRGSARGCRSGSTRQ